ncbi:MAG TPA: FecR domain-containing protein [bacterium]|nr:FecR domain-containing protein [bacterium]
MRSLILLLGWMLMAHQPLWADSMDSFANSIQAIFLSVNGEVKVIPANGKKPITAEKDMVVKEGARIIARNSSSAVLRMFDGSELTVSPKTEFELTKLQKLSDKDKVLKFELFIGKIAAAVKALTTSKSSFEIEAGGVVCAVRGTHYWMECDPQTKKVFLNVDEGKVLVQQNGHTSELVTAGEHRIFNNLHMTAPKGTSLKSLSMDVGAVPAADNSSSSPLDNPALKSMVKNSQTVNQTNKTNLVKTIQQNSVVGLHVGSGETAP